MAKYVLETDEMWDSYFRIDQGANYRWPSLKFCYAEINSGTNNSGNQSSIMEGEPLRLLWNKRFIIGIRLYAIVEVEEMTD